MTDFLNRTEGFPFNAMPQQQQFSLENMHEIKKMGQHDHSGLNDEFWGDMHGVAQSKKKKTEIIPVEVWENKENIYLIIVCPGLSTINHAKIFFHTDQVLTLKIKTHSLKPDGATTLLLSELPQQSYEREISLKKSVVTSDYSSS